RTPVRALRADARAPGASRFPAVARSVSIAHRCLVLSMLRPTTVRDPLRAARDQTPTPSTTSLPSPYHHSCGNRFPAKTARNQPTLDPAATLSFRGFTHERRAG